MKTLALDLATNIGFALGDRSGVILSGSRRLPKTGDDVGRFGRAFRDWLIIGLQRHKPELVVFEQPMLRGADTNLNTLRKLYGLAMLVELVCGDPKAIGQNEAIPVQEVNNGDWIKHFLGAGNVPRDSDARKKAVFRICGIRGWRPEDYDEGDALGILDYALSIESAEFALQATPLFADPPTLTPKEIRRRALAKAAGLSTSEEIGRHGSE
jgi:hypothetical protein